MQDSVYVKGKHLHGKLVGLPIVNDMANCVIVDKLIEIPCRRGESSILSNLYRSLHKPYIKNIGLIKPDIIYDLADQVGGLVVIAKDKQAYDALKNDYGSCKFELTFDLISEKSDVNKLLPFTCSLPLAKHISKDITVVSSCTGKQAKTEFTFMKNLGDYEHWQAKCTYLRGDQIQLHAYESGIRILGDSKYSRCKIPTFFELKHNFKENKKENNISPYNGTAIYLTALKLPDGSIIKANFPKKMEIFMKFLVNV